MVKIALYEGPNVIGLPENHEVFYVGYAREDQDLFWVLVEGLANDTPRSYSVYFGNGELTKAEFVEFSWNPDFTKISANYGELPCRLQISNRDANALWYCGAPSKDDDISRELQTAYSFFGERSATSMQPGNMANDGRHK